MLAVTKSSWSRCGRNASTKGFSLLELLCVIACCAMLVKLALPLALSYRAQRQLTTAVDALRHLLASAQAGALAQGHRMWVCGSHNGWQCDGDWSRYQLLVEGVGKVRRQVALPKTLTLTYHGNFGRNQAIEFLGNGMTHGQDGRFDFCTVATHAPRRCQSLILHFSGQTVG